MWGKTEKKSLQRASYYQILLETVASFVGSCTLITAFFVLVVFFVQEEIIVSIRREHINILYVVSAWGGKDTDLKKTQALNPSFRFADTDLCLLSQYWSSSR